jgi:signal transduction histidine kinase
MSDPGTVLARRLLAALLGAVGSVVGVLVQPTADGALELTAVGLMYGAYLAMALLILRVHPEHVVGRLMLVGGAVAGAGSGLLEVCWVRLDGHADDVGTRLGATVGSAGRGMGWLLVVLVLPLVFPDGRRAGPRRVRTLAWVVAWAALTVELVVSLLGPVPSDLRLRSVDSPIGAPRSWLPAFDALSGLFLLAAVLTLVLAVVCLVWRWRHAGSLDRQRLLWFALGFVLPVLVFGLSVVDVAKPWMFAVVSLPLPVAIAVACLQRRLYDLDLVVNRSLTYLALSLAIAALYALVVGGVGAMVRQQGAVWLPWVAAGVIAVSFAPLRDALQRAANKLTYGQWSQPAEVLAATGRRLADATDVPALLQALADELGQGLRLAYAEIVDVSGRTLARYGEPPADVERVPLVAYGEPVGDLFWGGRDLRETDRALVADLARQLGAVVHAAAMFNAVRASQERLVLAREEERKRLRRELHDGLGPALAGLMLQVETMRHRLGETAEEPLLALRAGIQATVLDVRRMVEGLRPPALDELGLAEALAQLAHRSETNGGPEVVVDVDCDGRLPAAVEVAAYRIVGEALSNAVRHSGATRVRVGLARDEAGLAVSVRDDGSGVVEPREQGVGLTSMRERAEEIGGRFMIRPLPGRGTEVRADLPIPRGAPT